MAPQTHLKSPGFNLLLVAGIVLGPVSPLVIEGLKVWERRFNPASISIYLVVAVTELYVLRRYRRNQDNWKIRMLLGSFGIVWAIAALLSMTL